MKHILYSFLFLLALAVGFSSCSKDSDSKPTNTLKVKPGTVSLVVGGSIILTAVWDNNGTETPVTETIEWSSSAPTNASVSADGLLTGLQAGTTTITAKANGKSATCLATISGLDATGKVLFIGISSVSLSEGEEFALTTYFINQDGLKTTASASWSVSNSNLATIGSDGKLKAKTEGAGFITASVTEGSKTYSSTIPFVVKKAIPKNGSGIDPSALTGFIAAPAAILWSDASPLDNLQIEWVYFGSGSLSTPTFSSSNPTVASVSSSGLVTLGNAGEAIITVSASAGSTNYSQQIPVVVVGMPTVALPVFRVDVTPGFQKSFLEKTIQFSAKAFNSTGAEVTGKPILWEIEDTEPDTADNGALEFAATVTSSGSVTTKAPRQVKVKATVEGVTGTANLWIYPDGFYTVSPLVFTIPLSGSQVITANYFEFDANFVVQPKPFPAATQWAVLNDLMFGFWPIKGMLSGSGNSRTYSVDPTSMLPSGSDIIFVMNPSNEKIMPAVSSAIIN